VYESTAKFPEGLFKGPAPNTHAVGLFDECKAVRAEEHDFVGRYCSVYVGLRQLNDSTSETPPSNAKRDERGYLINMGRYLRLIMSLINGGADDEIEPVVEDAKPGAWYNPSMSFCVPSSCTAFDLRTAVAELIGSFALSVPGEEEKYSLVTYLDDRLCFADTDPPPEFTAGDIAVM